MVRLDTLDALDFLSTLKPNSLDAVVTDPPYASGGQSLRQRKLDPTRKYSSRELDLPEFFGESRDQRNFTRWTRDWMQLSYRALKPGGILVTFIDWRQYPSLTDAMQAAEFSWRGVAAWHKPNSRPLKNGFRQELEFIPWATKGTAPKREVYLNGLFKHPNVSAQAKEHLTQKPKELMRELLSIVPPKGTVCDPFMGSGTTGVAAVELGLSFYGCEKSQGYFDIAQKRIKQAQRRLRQGSKP